MIPLPQYTPENVYDLCEQADIAAITELNAGFNGDDLAGLAVRITSDIQKTVPLYSELTVSPLQAIQEAAAHCAHRTAFIHAIAIRTPHVFSAIITRPYGHSVNLLASPVSGAAVLINNYRDVPEEKNFQARMEVVKIDLTGKPDSNNADHFIAQALLLHGADDDRKIRYHAKLGYDAKYRLFTPESATDLRKRPQTMRIGLSALRFIDRQFV